MWEFLTDIHFLMEIHWGGFLYSRGLLKYYYFEIFVEFKFSSHNANWKNNSEDIVFKQEVFYHNYHKIYPFSYHLFLH